MITSLEQIRAELDTRNVIAFVTQQRYAVNSVRTGHHEHVVFATVNGRVIEDTQKVFVGMESSPRVNEIIRLRKVFNCEGFENENI